MLNKLLKRCMPWMDKGRWYHVRIEGNSEGGYTVTYDNIFSRHEVVGGTRNGGRKLLHLFFADTNPKKTIIDTKSIPRSAENGYVINGYYYQPDIFNDGSAYYLEFSLDGPMPIDYWLFMR